MLIFALVCKAFAAAICIFVAAFLGLDVLVYGPSAGRPSVASTALWSGLFLVIGLGFAVWAGHSAALLRGGP